MAGVARELAGGNVRGHRDQVTEGFMGPGEFTPSDTQKACRLPLSGAGTKALRSSRLAYGESGAVQGAGSPGSGSSHRALPWARRWILSPNRRAPALPGAGRTVRRGRYGGRGLTADGDAQLHTTPLGQLHVEGAATRDDRLWVQTDVDPRETQPHIDAHPAGRDQPRPASYIREMRRPRHVS